MTIEDAAGKTLSSVKITMEVAEAISDLQELRKMLDEGLAHSRASGHKPKTVVLIFNKAGVGVSV